MACLYHLYYLYYSKSSGGSHQEAVIEAPGLRIPQRGSHQEGTGHIGLTRVCKQQEWMQNLVLLEYNLGHNLWMAIVLGRNNPQVFHNSDQIPFQLYCHPPQQHCWPIEPILIGSPPSQGCHCRNNTILDTWSSLSLSTFNWIVDDKHCHYQSCSNCGWWFITKDDP